MQILTIVGNRPQFVKAAAVSKPLRASFEEVLVHTGQHHDPELSDIFFQELEIPAPERFLNIAGGSNNSQIARMLEAIDAVIEEIRPDVVLVYGDTNSTLAAGLAAAHAKVPVAHVEAGMRSFDRTMPEEINRVLTDHLSSLLLCSTETAVQNLANEGVTGDVELVGDVMVDVALLVQPRARERIELLERLSVERGEYLLVTAHRAGNVDSPETLRRLVELLAVVPDQIVLPLHPRMAARLAEHGLDSTLAGLDHVEVTQPLGYLDFQTLLCNAKAMVTDSGGVQKEAYLASVPCITLRTTTEWVETLEAGWNVLTGLDAEAVLTALAAPTPAEHPPIYGSGGAAERVVAAVGALSS